MLLSYIRAIVTFLRGSYAQLIVDGGHFEVWSAEKFE
jgi:hypothetical protein